MVSQLHDNHDKNGAVICKSSILLIEIQVQHFLIIVMCDYINKIICCLLVLIIFFIIGGFHTDKGITPIIKQICAEYGIKYNYVDSFVEILQLHYGFLWGPF